MGGPAMIEGGGLGVFEPGEVGPIDVQHANGVVDLRVGRRRAGGAAGQALPLLLPRPDAAGAVPDQELLRELIPRAAQARLRRAPRRRDAVRRGLGARAARRLRRRDADRARARRRPPAGRASPTTPRISAARSTRTAPTRRRASCSCATRSSLPRAVPVRHARVHGRPGGRAHGDGAPLRAHVPGRRQPERADGHDRAAQGLRAGRAGDGRRRLQGAAVHRRVADVGVRRHGPGGRGAAGHAPRARGDRGRAGARAPVRGSWSPPPTSAAAA